MATHAIESVIDTATPSRRRFIPFVILGSVTLVLAVIGFNRWRFGRVHVSTDNAQLDGHITVIAPKVQAFVSSVRVDDNQHVKEGDTLVVLDDRDLRVREAQVEADLANALAAAGSNTRGGQAKAEFAWSEAQASSAEANVASAEAEARKAAADLERIRGLAADRIVPAQQLDAAQAATDAAQAHLAAVRKQAMAAQSQVSAYGAGMSGANARLAAARAARSSRRTHPPVRWRSSRRRSSRH